MIKAYRKQDRVLVDAVYSAIPAAMVGREQTIEVGPMSGRSNVLFWMEKRGLAVTDAQVDAVFARAKASAVRADRRRDPRRAASERLYSACLPTS